MKNFLTYLNKKRWYVFIALIAAIAAVYYFYFYTGTTATTDTYAVVETVGRGSVSSGIQTSGTIVAAQKLSLDVYKQSRRIEAVNVKNAGQVSKGTVLYSFDKSSTYVSIQSSRVDIAEAELALAAEQATYGDANTALRTLQNTLVTLRTDIVEAEKDLVEAQRNFYSANLGVESGNTGTKDKNRPTISGVYNGTAEGVYRIKVYASAAASGYSYQVSGLETGTESVLASVATPIGTQGLQISFPPDIRSGDEWIIAVPNTYAPEYVKNKAAYESTVRTLTEQIASKKVSIANTEVDIKNQSQTDGVPYRNLDIAKAEAKLSASRQQLSEQYDVVHEQDIIAPFAGTIEGMANVVVGASPTGATNDSISLGTLISDEFLVTFDLSAVDVAKVQVGQKVLVDVTSFPGSPALDAAITEVSSLPKSDGVAQYEVQALITLPASSTVKLREGLLASIIVVDTEVPDVVRVPLSAISYENGQAKVMVVGDLTTEQQKELATLGVIKSVAGSFPSYAVNVEVGVTGTFFAEIKSGLTEGMQIIVTNTESDTAVVEEKNFGPPDRNNDSSNRSSGEAAPAQ